MKILDKYIIQSLLLSFFICMMTIMAFFIIIHMFENFARFVTFLDMSNAAAKKYGHTEETLFSLMFFHYFHLSPLILYNFAPILTLISSIFTIIRMVQSREMLLLQSMSISNTRIMAPFLLFACIVSIGMFFLQEFIIPNFSEEIIENNKIRKGRKTRSSFQYKDLSGKIFYIDEVDPLSKKVINLRITMFDQNNYKVVKVIEAKNGTWPEEAKEEIFLMNGVIFDYIQNKEYKIPQEGMTLETEMNIYRIISPSKNFDILSTKELLEMVKNSNDVEIVMSLYSKLTIPLSNIFILLICMPIILNTSFSHFFARITICIIVTSCFYGFNLACLSLGKKELLTPIFASFFPLLLLICGGLALSIQKR